MKKIVVAGYYGYRNSGDDAILHSICQDLRQLNQNNQITVLSNEPNLTMKEYPVHAVYRFSLLKVIRALKQSDLLLLGGGSLIQDMTSTRSLYYYLGLLWIAMLFKKPIIIYANGIGPLVHRYNRPFTRWTLNRVNVITLRERLSKEALSLLKITKPQIEVTADPVFNLQIKKEQSINEILHREKIPTDKPLFGVMFRSWNNQSHYVATMARICDALVETYDCYIIFVPMKYPSDLTVAIDINAAMEHKGTILEHRYNEETLINFMGHMDLMLCMRLHAMIYGALEHVPMLGFNYDPKVEYYAKELGIPYVKDMKSIDMEDVLSMIHEVLTHREVYDVRIKEQVLRLKAAAKRNPYWVEWLLEQS